MAWQSASLANCTHVLVAPGVKVFGFTVVLFNSNCIGTALQAD